MKYMMLKMKKFKFILFIVVFFVSTFFAKNDFAIAATEDTVTLTTTVQLYIALEVTAGDTIAFGNLTPGSPSKSTGGTTISVSTSSADGYKLFIEDGIAATNSALLHTDTTTRIADYGGTIGTPTSWSGTGLGFCLYSGTAKAAKWGTGTTYDDANNKYAGVPETATEIMDKTTYSASADLSYVAWQIDVPNDQKTGSYSGNVTISAVANMS